MTSLAFVLETTIPLWVGEGPRVEQGRPPIVHEKCEAQLKSLKQCGLLRVTKRGSQPWPEWWSSYFTVSKTETTSRSIFNGKIMSKRCPRPPLVNLLSTYELVRMMAGVAAHKKRLYVVRRLATLVPPDPGPRSFAALVWFTQRQ